MFSLLARKSPGTLFQEYLNTGGEPGTSLFPTGKIIENNEFSGKRANQNQ
jgi:hypothetical protein